MPRNHQSRTAANDDAPRRTSIDLAYWREFYDPIDDGLHICGISYERNPGGELQTVANIASNDPRALFEQLQEFAVPHEDADLVVDLMINGNCEEDFSIRRQSVELIESVWRFPQPGGCAPGRLRCLPSRRLTGLSKRVPISGCPAGETNFGAH
jgi:hypothetical protein